MPKEMDFFIFLIEQYAAYKHVSADKILKDWDKLKITDYIFSMYERYHTEALENAFDDIDKLMNNKTAC